MSEKKDIVPGPAVATNAILPERQEQAPADLPCNQLRPENRPGLCRREKSSDVGPIGRPALTNMRSAGW